MKSEKSIIMQSMQPTSYRPITTVFDEMSPFKKRLAGGDNLNLSNSDNKNTNLRERMKSTAVKGTVIQKIMRNFERKNVLKQKVND